MSVDDDITYRIRHLYGVCVPDTTSNIQHIEVTRDAFPKHWTDEKGVRRYTVLIARPDGPYGKVRVKKGQSVFWKEDGGITYYLENVGRKPITFEIIPSKGEPDGTETA